MQYLQGDNAPRVSELPPQKNDDYSDPQNFRFIGSHDTIIELLCEFLKHSANPVALRTFYKGSMEGLIALYRREAEITGIHLWDEKTEDYNLPYIKYLLPCEPVTVINLVQRVQGWIVPMGNPLQLSSWLDISRKDIRFINRQKGSGTRLRIDQYLTEHGISPSHIHGYDKEETNHMSLALKIANGDANAGIGVQAAAHKIGLDFVPLFNERFDIVILRETENRPEWTQILSIINAPAFHRAIEQQVGYDSSLTGKIMLQT